MRRSEGRSFVGVLKRPVSNYLRDCRPDFQRFSAPRNRMIVRLLGIGTPSLQAAPCEKAQCKGVGF